MQPPKLTENERIALETIRRSNAMTRHGIAQALGITRMHATNITKSLIDKELIIDEPAATGARGQPTRIVRLSPDSAYAVGASFTEHYVEIGVVNWVGALKSRDTIRISNARLDTLSETIQDYASDAAKRSRIAKKRLCGVGISLPGDFMEDRKKINAVYFPEFTGLNLETEFQKRIGDNVFVENDSSSAAWGESIVGAGKQLESFIFIHIGHGLGGGLVLEGRLIRGRHGNAGAFGAPFPDLEKPRPSGSDLLHSLVRKGVKASDFADLKDLDIETPALRAWIKRAAKQLTQPLTVLARAFDPEALIIGGRLPSHIINRLVEELDTQAFCAHDRDVLPTPKIIPSALGDTGGVIGAASLCFEYAFFAKRR